jgi:hypothetical protein
MSLNQTETPAGRAWLEKYLHPPSVQKSSYSGIPDNNMSPITTLAFETINNIPTSFVQSGTTYQASDMFFLQTTGARVVAYVFVRTPTFANNLWVQHPQFPAILNDSYDFGGNWGADVSMQRMAYKSCTYYLNATSFNDQGTVTIAQTRPAIFTFQGAVLPPSNSASDVSRVKSLNAASFEQVGKPIPRASALNNEYDYNSQIFDIGDVSGNGSVGQYMPASPTQVQQSNPRATTHMARLGAFVPQHWSQPTNRFYNNPDTGNGSQTDLTQSLIRFIDNTGLEHTVRLWSKLNADGTEPTIPTIDNATDTTWTDFTFAYVYFSGLTVSTDALIGNAYITVKSLYGIEVQPNIKSSFVFFQNNPPVPDDRAVHMAAAMVHQVPDGYPSSANDFGSIISLAAKYVPKVVSWLSNAFSANAPSEKKIEEKVIRAVNNTPVNTKKKRNKRPKTPRASNTPDNSLSNRINQLEKQLQGTKLRGPPARYTPSRPPSRFTNRPPSGLRKPTPIRASTNSSAPTPLMPVNNFRPRFSNRL